MLTNFYAHSALGFYSRALWLCSMTFGVSGGRDSCGTVSGRRGAQAPAARPDSVCIAHTASGFYSRALWREVEERAEAE